MRAALLLVLVGSFIGCRPPLQADTLNVTVERALTDEGYQPPVFRWDAPVAARLTVSRGRLVVWDVAEGDRQGPDGRARRGPLLPPLTYGTAFSENEVGAVPRTLVPPSSLEPGVVYSVTVVGYDGATGKATFSVQAPFSF